MPQFDLSSFAVQLVWLFICFFLFYFVISWIYLPMSAFLLKTRKKPSKISSETTLNLNTYSLPLTLKLNKETSKSFFVCTTKDYAI